VRSTLQTKYPMRAMRGNDRQWRKQKRLSRQAQHYAALPTPFWANQALPIRRHHGARQPSGSGFYQWIREAFTASESRSLWISQHRSGKLLRQPLNQTTRHDVLGQASSRQGQVMRQLPTEWEGKIRPAAMGGSAVMPSFSSELLEPHSSVSAPSLPALHVDHG